MEGIHLTLEKEGEYIRSIQGYIPPTLGYPGYTSITLVLQGHMLE